MDILYPDASNDNPIMYTCSGPCGRTLPRTREYFHSNGRLGLYPQCKECKCQKKRTHDKLPDVQKRVSTYNKTYHKEYYSQPDKREHKREQDNTYYHQSDNHDRIRAMQKTYNETYLRRPEAQAKRLANKRNRDARKKSVGGKFTQKQVQDLLKRQKCKCYYCSSLFEEKNGKYIYHIDHTFPLSRIAGTDIPANDISYLVLACPYCNQSKGDKFPWEWSEGGRLL